MSEHFVAPDLSVNERELPKNDPRSYFNETVFTAVGEKIDPSEDTSWRRKRAANQSKKYFFEKNTASVLMARDDHSLVIVGENREKKYHFSHVIPELSLTQLNMFTHVFSLGFEMLPSDKKLSFIHKVVDLETELLKLNDEELDFFLANLLAVAMDQRLSTCINAHYKYEIDKKEFPPELLEKLERLSQNLGKRLNVPYEQILSAMSVQGTWILSAQYSGNRYLDLLSVVFQPNNQDNSWQSSELKPLAFDIKPFITTELDLDDEETLLQEVQKRLSHFSNNDLKMTDNVAKSLFRSTIRPEFVNANEIEGGQTGGSTWGELINDRRDKYVIPQMVRDLNKGTPINFFDQKNPIQLLRYNGKLYLYGDGTHRVAALKVLGVTRFPAMVTSTNNKFD